ncbi:MAG TPA: D-serine ammonia-lyase [Desulfosporosinus sp.]|nr:D-serine ammonia-lyase [Desulfosporosinus sp.]
MVYDLIVGKTIEEWKKLYPLLEDIVATREVLWANPQYRPFEEAIRNLSIGEAEVKNAEERLARFAPYILQVFPETKNSLGLIESPLKNIPGMQKEMERLFDRQIPGEVLLKCDNQLPIAGSIKARGGIYEVLKHAEELALQNKLLTVNDDYAVFDSPIFRAFFSRYSIAVGSTGNLGLSIGIMGAQLGFKVTVHMSADAKLWKKELLRSKNVQVIEYASDFSKAVEEGRKQSNRDPNSYFIDDEKSQDLFLGYAVAAYRLQKQLKDLQVTVDENHPLFVYLPCGVGGSPGGITYGLKLIFKDHVHCFFAEPTHSPAMLIGLMTGLHHQVAVQDFGLDNQTAADGLAVGRPSGLVSKTLEHLISGVVTVDDRPLFVFLKMLIDAETMPLEPSALAGFLGIGRLINDPAGKNYLAGHKLTDKLQEATHIVWATGGSMVPQEIMEGYYQRGLKYSLK